MIKKRRIERLARREEKKLINRIFFLSALSIIIAIFIFTLGVPILSRFADFTGSIFNSSRDGENAEDVFLSIPILDTLPEATNSSKLFISGFASNAQKVKIFLDESEEAEVSVEGGKFRFDNIILKIGENRIFAKSISGEKESGPSDSAVIIFDEDEPMLEVETPIEGQTITGNNRIRVFGKTDKDAQVYANGFSGSTNAEGVFELVVPLVVGENTIEVKAVDEAGNSKIETRKVNFRKD